LRDIFVPLLAGGTICIPDNKTLMNPKKLVKWINENKIRLIHIVPSLFKLIPLEIRGADDFPDLEYILLAGELIRGNDIREFIEIFDGRIQLVNIYGPTETTLAKFFYRIQPSDVEKSIIPVGKTIKGAEVLVLDERRQKCLTGNIGEIYIRTPYISSGYFNNKESNKEVFIKNPFSEDKNDIIYKTGDMGRVLFDGNVELTGRLDGQVKIGGHRVETGEIENLLLKIDYIKEAVVVDKEDKNGDKYLCAFLVPEAGGNREKVPDINELKIMLAKHIPFYMMPSFFILLDAMPLNPNGKINRLHLRKLDVTVDNGETYTAPKDELEKRIAEIWKDVLKLDKIGSSNNFFNVGGTSLNAIRVNSRIGEMVGKDIPIVKFFEFPTIGSYAKYLASNSPQPPDRKKISERMEAMTQKRGNMALRKQKLKELKNE
jgi:acyl-coenzyme A synthetase/AMP-(fatty) acid ligase/acyl carrier protein